MPNLGGMLWLASGVWCFVVELGTSHAEMCGSLLFRDCDCELLYNSPGQHSLSYPSERTKGKTFSSLSIAR